MFDNAHLTAPEIKFYLLTSNDGRVRVEVTDADLERVFSPEDIIKLKSNRHKFYILEDLSMV